MASEKGDCMNGFTTEAQSSQRAQMGSAAGLEGVVAAQSAITFVDGTAGDLRYRGYAVPDLAAAKSFEEVAALLWDGELPAGPEPLRGETGRHWQLEPSSTATVATLAESAAPLEVLRTVVSAAPKLADESVEANRARAVHVVALVHAAVATLACARARRPLPVFRAGDSAARALLRALTGDEPTVEQERLFDAILVLHADHELNASTFAARIVAATEAEMYGAVTAAVAALQGPKHGGANEDVAEMIAEIGSPERARAWAQEKLQRYREMTPDERKAPGARFAGFGHRVYKVDDPRAVVLRQMASDLVSNGRAADALEIAEAVREVVQSELRLPLNVDYYSAIVYVGLGIEPAMFTSVFAASRVAGWCAHVMEQHANNRLIRPRAEYVGSAPRMLQNVTVSS